MNWNTAADRFCCRRRDAWRRTGAPLWFEAKTADAGQKLSEGEPVLKPEARCHGKRIRHGETAWSLSGQHTGTTDIPLTENGRRLAEQMRPVLARNAFALVPCSPMQRARETCALAGLSDTAVIDPDLVEWNYGEYEGLTPKQIHEATPGWPIFRDGCPAGEAPEPVGVRVDRVIARSRAAPGDVALFAHGHVLRVLAARWIGLPAGAGQHFLLDTGTLCVLGYYRDIPAVRVWNGLLLG
jgi:broad specificity phosphatase PhoE